MKLEKIKTYIFRRWNEREHIHPLLKILPPFFYELIGYLIGLAIIYQLGVYLVGLLDFT